MLFFMASSAHFGHGPMTGSTTALAVALVITAAIEVNAIVGKPGPIASVNGVITGGFVLTGVLWAVVELL
jgi:hypothetical protein